MRAKRYFIEEQRPNEKWYRLFLGNNYDSLEFSYNSLEFTQNLLNQCKANNLLENNYRIVEITERVL